MTAKRAFQQKFFTCLLPPQGIKDRFNAIAKLAPEGADVKRAEDLHISLNFLVKPRRQPARDLQERLRRIEFPAFDLKMTGMDSFFRIPRRDLNTHVVWMRPDGLSAWHVMDLRAKILLSLRPAGYPVGSTAMTPHMTALKYPFHAAAGPLEDFLAAHDSLNMPAWHCDEFFLARTKTKDDPSHPDNGGTGSKYDIIERFPLKAF